MQAELAAPQLLPPTHLSPNNAFIRDKSCCTTPACLTRCSCHKCCKGNWTNTRQLLPHSFPVIYPPGAIKLMPQAGQSHHTSTLPLTTSGTDQMWRTVWNSSSVKQTILLPSFPSPPCLLLFSKQSSKVEWKMVWVSSPCTIPRAVRFVRKSVFQLKKAIQDLLYQRPHQESFEN